MAHYEEDYEYEYEPERKSRFWSKFLAVLLGFILGLVCTLGGLAGLGYVLFAKIKIKDGFDTVNKITGSNIDYTEYVTEEYAQKTVYGLLKDLTQIASDFQSGNASLSSLEKFSPMVRKTAEKLKDQMEEYGVVIDTDVFLATPLSEMSAFFKDTVNDIEVGTMLDKAGILEESNDSYALLMALSYGEEGEDYTLDEAGNVVMLDGKKPTTFGTMTTDTYQVLDKVSLSAIMKDEDTSDPLTRALLYGTEGETYTYDETTGTVEMLPLSYKYNETEKTITDPEGIVYSYDETTGRWTAENGNYISAQSVKESGEQYDFIVYTPENEMICGLKATETPGVYQVYDKTGKLLKHKPLSVGALTSGNVTEIFEDMQLKDVLNITAESDAILISLAYGNEGEDFKIVTNEDGTKDIVMKEGKKPRTVKDLKDKNMIDSVRLSAIITPDPEDKITMYILYGVEGKDYEIDKDGNIVMLDGKTPRTIGDLSGENSPISTITRDLTLGDVISIDENDEESSALLISLKDTPIDQLSTKINTLTLTEILGETDVEGNTFLKHLKDSTIKTFADDLEALTIQQIFEDEIYQKDEDGNFVTDENGEKILTGTWKYLLTENGKEVQYKISEVNKLVGNMTTNVQSATLEDLHKDGIITTDNTAFLETDILYKYVVGGTTIFNIDPIENENGQEKTKIGELTITEMLNYVTKVLQALNQTQKA